MKSKAHLKQVDVNKENTTQKQHLRKFGTLKCSLKKEIENQWSPAKKLDKCEQMKQQKESTTMKTETPERKCKQSRKLSQED